MSTKLTSTFVQKGELTDRGRVVVRKLAAAGCTTEEILEILPNAPRKSVIAHIAIAHRTPKN